MVTEVAGTPGPMKHNGGSHVNADVDVTYSVTVTVTDVGCMNSPEVTTIPRARKRTPTRMAVLLWYWCVM